MLSWLSPECSTFTWHIGVQWQLWSAVFILQDAKVEGVECLMTYYIMGAATHMISGSSCVCLACLDKVINSHGPVPFIHPRNSFLILPLLLQGRWQAVFPFEIFSTLKYLVYRSTLFSAFFLDYPDAAWKHWDWVTDYFWGKESLYWVNTRSYLELPQTGYFPLRICNSVCGFTAVELWWAPC